MTIGKRKNRNWRKHLAKARRVANYTAAIEVTAIEARLLARLDPETWTEIEAEWNGKPAHESYLPQQRRNFLEAIASRHDVSLAGIGEAFLEDV